MLLEGLVEANTLLAKRPSARRAIVVVNLEPGTEQSREDPKKILDTMRKSVAQLWVVSYQQGTARALHPGCGAQSIVEGDRRQPRIHRGRLRAGTVLRRYADILTSEYEVSYARADSSKPAQEVRIGTTRAGVVLHASGFPPQWKRRCALRTVGFHRVRRVQSPSLITPAKEDLTDGANLFHTHGHLRGHAADGIGRHGARHDRRSENDRHVQRTGIGPWHHTAGR